MNIAIVSGGLDCAGVAKACVNMLKEIAKKEPNWRITLFLTCSERALIDELPDTVEIVETTYQGYNFGFQEAINICKSRGKIHMLPRVIWKRFRLWRNKNFNEWISFQCKNLLPKESNKQKFDIAIAYQGRGRRSTYYALEYVEAPIKVMWIHEDVKSGSETENEYYELYNRFSYIFCVSETCKDRFVEVYPKLAEKTKVCYNSFNVEEILRLADEYIPQNYDEDKTHILTVGRLSEEKGVCLIPEIAERIKKEYSEKFIWHIVGDGVLRTMLEKKIEEKGLQNCISLHGALLNPYPHFKCADIYVQPSYTESFSFTVCEAKILGKAIVMSEIPVAHEVLCNNETGIIVPIEVDEFARAIGSLMKDKEKRQLLSENLKMQNYHMADVCEILKSLK